MVDFLDISSKDSVATINYLSNIAADRDNNFQPLKWNNSVILRNCSDNGELVDLKKPSEYLSYLLLTLKLSPIRVRCTLSSRAPPAHQIS